VRIYKWKRKKEKKRKLAPHWKSSHHMCLTTKINRITQQNKFFDHQNQSHKSSECNEATDAYNTCIGSFFVVFFYENTTLSL
jgi:hypothetical protein